VEAKLKEQEHQLLVFFLEAQPQLIKLVQKNLQVPEYTKLLKFVL
jgi:hypothetical protein